MPHHTTHLDVMHFTYLYYITNTGELLGTRGWFQAESDVESEAQAGLNDLRQATKMDPFNQWYRYFCCVCVYTSALTYAHSHSFSLTLTLTQLTLTFTLTLKLNLSSLTGCTTNLRSTWNGLDKSKKHCSVTRMLTIVAVTVLWTE